MARILGIDIPNNKQLEISLTYIYGIGRKTSQEIIRKAGFDPSMRAQKLTENDIAKLNAIIQQDYIVEGDLRREVQNNIKRLISINCYRGLRHRLGLPVRGQRTRCNARTRKGRKKGSPIKKK